MSKRRNSNSPKISIVIPSYNKVDYISYTLDSIVEQDYKNYELIIQDGGSTDGSVKIIEEYAKKYPKLISWVSKKDKGQVDAINKGMKKAKGEILAYINADDVYKKGAFKIVAQTYRTNPNAIWFAGKGKIIDKNGNERSKWVTYYKNILLKTNRYSLLLMVNYFVQPSVFITKEVFNKFGPFTGIGGIVMEYDLWLKLGLQKMPLVINDYLANFRLTSDNISSTQHEKLLAYDNKIVAKYSKNKLLLLMHNLHNIGRIKMA